MTTENAKSGDSRLDQVIAGEYVLGALSPEDRTKVEARMMLDRNFAAMVDHWQSNMMTVDETPRPTRRSMRRPASPFAAPLPAMGKLPDMTARGRSGLWSGALLQSVAFWRGVAGIASLGFLSVLISQTGIFSAPVAKPLSTRLTLDGSDLALTANYDVMTGRLRVAPVAAAAVAPGPAEAKSLEVWLTQDGRSPVSLGVLSSANSGDLSVPKSIRSRIANGTALAVSLEPAGGSPTGAPTGAILARGATGR